MNLLREYIRVLLTEAAMGPGDLPDGIGIEIFQDDDYKKVSYVYVDGPEAGKGTNEDPWGRISMSALSPNHPYGHCGGAWMVQDVEAASGWGPLLYDIAMELAGSNGLTADRDSLTNSAYQVWLYYKSSRSDVVKRQLDDLSNTLTPDEEDNCDVMTALRHSGIKSDQLFSPEWDEGLAASFLIDSPVMKVYSKGPSTIQALKAAGKLLARGWDI